MPEQCKAPADFSPSDGKYIYDILLVCTFEKGHEGEHSWEAPYPPDSGMHKHYDTR